jgi:regulator of RNase E activity RraA
MSRYFFHLRFGDEIYADHVGVELLNEDEALTTAERASEIMRKSADERMRIHLHEMLIEVMAANGRLLGVEPIGYRH